MPTESGLRRGKKNHNISPISLASNAWNLFESYRTTEKSIVTDKRSEIEFAYVYFSSSKQPVTTSQHDHVDS